MPELCLHHHPVTKTHELVEPDLSNEDTSTLAKPHDNYTGIRMISWYASKILFLTAMNISMAMENFSIAITTS